MYIENINSVICRYVFPRDTKTAYFICVRLEGNTVPTHWCFCFLFNMTVDITYIDLSWPSNVAAP